MPDEKALSGARYNDHLRRVRVKKNVSLEMLHEETKIPRDLLDEFEESGLLNHPQFNRVYLRSFVRTYAQAIGIKPEEALEALEESFDDRYGGSLAVLYLGQKVKKKPIETAEATGGAAGAEPTAEVADVPEADLPAETTSPSWLDQSPPPGTRMATPPARPAASRSPRQRSGGDSDAGKYAILVIVLLVIIGAALWFFLGRGGIDGERGTTAPPIAQEEPATPMEPMPPPPEPEPVTLGETFSVTFVAAGGPVQAMRATIDDDVRRPYWIEEGESLNMNVRQRIVIDPERLGNVRLQVEGRDYPMDRRDEGDRIVITREDVQAFLAGTS
jgi:hypothetical protein